MYKTVVIVCSLLFILSFARAQKRELSYDQSFHNAPSGISKPLPDIVDWLDEDHYIERKSLNGKQVLVSVAALSGIETAYSAPVKVTGEDAAIPGDAINPVHSPDGKWIAFTRKNDLYAKELKTGKEIRFTQDGSGDVYNGYAAWVYYEEILHRESEYSAFWWSPDSRHIAFIHFDETNVPVFPLYKTGDRHGSIERRHYPQPGDQNPKVKMGIVSVENPKTVWADFDENTDQYFPTPYWYPNGSSLWVQWMPRSQHELKIFKVDISSGTKKELYSEKQATWVLEKYIYFLQGGTRFMVSGDRDGWNHLYFYDTSGKLLSQTPRADFPVINADLIDESKKIIYFSANGENPARADVYKSGFDGSGLTRLSFGDYNFSDVLFSPHGKYFIVSYSNTRNPPRMALLNAEGKLIRLLGDSRGENFGIYEQATSEFRTVKSRDSLFQLPVRIRYPLHFDPNKKYPVLIEVYGGPSLGKVFDVWSADLREQWWAREGLIQVWMDSRSCGQFGKKGMNFIYRQIGKYEIEDFIDCTNWLRSQSFVDTSRICLTGFSFGGYMTCMGLTYGAGVFTHGIAYYPVTDWKLYDSYYTEKFMGLPADNADGYATSSVLSYTSRYKGLLRIVHGTSDENVHLENSLQLVSNLEDLHRHFELMLYPGERHGRGKWSSDKREQSRQEDYTFIYENLLRKPTPAFFLK